MVKRNRGYEMVQDVRFDDVVEDAGIDKSKVMVNGCGGSPSKFHVELSIMRGAWIGMSKQRDGD